MSLTKYLLKCLKKLKQFPRITPCILLSLSIVTYYFYPEVLLGKPSVGSLELLPGKDDRCLDRSVPRSLGLLAREFLGYVLKVVGPLLGDSE